MIEEYGLPGTSARKIAKAQWYAKMCQLVGSPETTEPGETLAERWCRTHPPNLLEKHKLTVGYRALAWKEAAEKHGADFIDFGRALEAASPHGILAERFFADRQHLLPLGYLYLARLVAAPIGASLGGAPAGEVAAPAEDEVLPYLDAVWASPVEVALEQVARGWYVTGVPGLLYAVKAFPPERCARKRPAFCAQIELAAVTLGWLRKRAGLDPGVSPDLLIRVESFEVMKALEELRRLNREQT